MTQLFTEKYAPRKYSEIIGNLKAINAAKQWAKNWVTKGRQKALLLYGPPGCGKTALAQVIAYENGWEIVEINASDEREREKLRQLLAPATSMTTLNGKKRLIILDEIEGISAKDIADISERSQQPIILIANDPFGKKIGPIRALTIPIKLDKINRITLEQFIKKIARASAIAIDEHSLSQIASGGDVRSALLDLQVGLASKRDREKNIFQVVRSVLKSYSFGAARAVIKEIDIDPRTLLLWLAENIQNEYKSPRELWQAYSALARADLFEGRARRKQAWKLEKYTYDLATAGVALAKESKESKGLSNVGFVSYSFPKALRKNEKSAARKALKSAAKKIAKSMHTSSRKIARDLQIIATFTDLSKYNLDSLELETLKKMRRFPNS